MLVSFTDTWDDLVNDNGDPLRFGMVHYTNTKVCMAEWLDGHLGSSGSRVETLLE